MLTEIKKYAIGLHSNDNVIKWVDTTLYKFLTKKALSIDTQEHIVDYLNSTDSPAKLEGMSVKQAIGKAQTWIDNLNEKAKGISENKNDTKIILELNNGYKIVQLIKEPAYKREGMLMRNCVASYFGKNVEIYSLRDRHNMPHCTIEKDQQIKGKGNGDISPKYIDFIITFLEFIGMNVRDNEMKHLGYKVVALNQYVKNKLYKNKYIRENEKIIYNDNVVVFQHIDEVAKYKGDKICLLNGDANFENSEIATLDNLTSIGGNVYFENSKLTSLRNLNSIGGNVYFANSELTSLDNLNSIGGNVYFKNNKITSLNNLTSIAGNVYFANSELTSLRNLNSIGGNVYFANSELTSLDNLTSIAGNVYFENSKITSLNNLTSIGGYANFENSEITSLRNLTSIDGNADFANSEITSLDNLTSIGGYADFRDSKLTSLRNLTSIGGYADFRDSKLTSLRNLTAIGGYVYFANSEIISLRNLTSIAGSKLAC